METTKIKKLKLKVIYGGLTYKVLWIEKAKYLDFKKLFIYNKNTSAGYIDAEEIDIFI